MAQTESRLGPRSLPSAEEQFPRRRGLIVLLGILGGFALTVVWSAALVDRTIGDNVANTVLGYDAKETPITGVAAGIAFAFASGLACTFTACNVAAFSAVAPMLGRRRSGRARLAETLKPVGWLAVGALTVAAAYGVVVGLFGTHMPQYSTATAASGLSARNVQSMIAFGLISVALLYLGLAALGVVRDPLARVSERFPAARLVVLGALIGGFLVGRPFALFRKGFRDVADSHNPFYGATAFMLESLGNVLLIAVIFLLLAYATGGRVQRWLSESPSRIAAITGAGLIAAGAFTLLYWDLRVLARRDLIPWYPMMPWS
jgi:hypothetical protein